jgi:BirA family biotin operon repressor/biotin-[acetyl-CoA-carboxylase] ligase
LSSNLSDLPPDFAAAVERSRPRLKRLGSTILYVPTIGSTNDLALTLAARGGYEGAVVTADEQTSGRGRRGRTWFSPPGSGLYVSVVLAPGRARVDPGRALALLTLAAGVALSEAVEAATGLRTDIKWPNDLVASRRKVAGILAEGAAAPSAAHGDNDGSMDSVILGYGVNVGPMAYPPDLRDRATSLETELGRHVDRPELFVETLVRLSQRYDDLLEGRFDVILDAWRRRAPATRGARVRWQATDGSQTGVTAGIDNLGALLVRVGDRLERIVAGELTWL